MVESKHNKDEVSESWKKEEEKEKKTIFFVVVARVLGRWVFAHIIFSHYQ